MWISQQEALSRLRDGVSTSLSIAYVSASAIYIFLAPIFIEEEANLEANVRLLPFLLTLLAPTLLQLAADTQSRSLDTVLYHILSCPSTW